MNKRQKQAIKKLLKELTEQHSEYMIVAIQAATKKLEEEKIEDAVLSEKFYKKVIMERLETYGNSLVEGLTVVNNKLGTPVIVKPDYSGDLPDLSEI